MKADADPAGSDYTAPALPTPPTSMATIPEQTIREIREKADIVELIGRHVALKPSGRQFKGRCPFHEERTPSFYVDPKRRGYKCFGCGEWGDSIDFVRKIEGKSFIEALAGLAGMAGVALPEVSQQTRERAAVNDAQRDRAFAINAHAAGYFQRMLAEGDAGERAREYAQQRQLTGDWAEKFRLGYAPAPTEHGWDGLTRSLNGSGHDLKLAQSLGLIGTSERNQTRYYDKFRGRLMFPIMAPGGSIVGFSGRILPIHEDDGRGEGKAPKYTNSTESLLYKKSELLFGLSQASQQIRAKGRAILVEGNVDVLAMHRRGYGETLAPLGTALTSKQAEKIGRFTEVIVMCFDGDRAGLEAAWKALPLLLAAGLDVRIAALPEGEDPDSCDEERLRVLLDGVEGGGPTSALTWMLRRMVRRGATSSPDARAKALSKIAPLIASVAKQSVREQHAHLTAQLLELDLARVLTVCGLPSAPESGGERNERGSGRWSNDFQSRRGGENWSGKGKGGSASASSWGQKAGGQWRGRSGGSSGWHSKGPRDHNQVPGTMPTAAWQRDSGASTGAARVTRAAYDQPRPRSPRAPGPQAETGRLQPTPPTPTRTATSRPPLEQKTRPTGQQPPGPTVHQGGPPGTASPEPPAFPRGDPSMMIDDLEFDRIAGYSEADENGFGPSDSDLDLHDMLVCEEFVPPDPSEVPDEVRSSGSAQSTPPPPGPPSEPAGPPHPPSNTPLDRPGPQAAKPGDPSRARPSPPRPQGTKPAPLGPLPSLPPGQCTLTALLIDRPETARLAEREGVLDEVADPRLAPLVRKVIEAALAGDPQPSEGALLALVDENYHRDLHEQVFLGNYAEIEDPKAVLTEGLSVCRTESIDREISEIDAQAADARDSGDLDRLRELASRKIDLRRRQAKLRSEQYTV